jgi:hypothetical protein
MKPNTVTIHLAVGADGVVDPDAPVLIIGPDGSPHTFWILPGELDLFAGALAASFEVELDDTGDAITWRPIRRTDMH